MNSSEESSYDYVFKLVIIGDSGVGKTNLLNRFVHDKFEYSSKSTIGLDLTIKNMNVKGKRIRAQIWDTAGQERYRSITKRYYRGSVGALLVYDISKRESFDNVSRWLSEIRSNESHPDVVVMLFGNKSDLESTREVSQEEARGYSEANNLMFMETSALDNINVELAFNTLIFHIYDKISSKLTTIDDKKVELRKGQSIQLTAPVNTDTSSQGCAC
ncbi:ras-domain-containing protein [Pilobolus umbonatus]|nr:ras-domain-containing protein [Pilobolus umbonatus]